MKGIIRKVWSVSNVFPSGWVYPFDFSSPDEQSGAMCLSPGPWRQRKHTRQWRKVMWRLFFSLPLNCCCVRCLPLQWWQMEQQRWPDKTPLSWRSGCSVWDIFGKMRVRMSSREHQLGVFQLLAPLDCSIISNPDPVSNNQCQVLLNSIRGKLQLYICKWKLGLFSQITNIWVVIITTAGKLLIISVVCLGW